MADGITITTEGIEPLIRRLNALPKKVQRTIARKVLRAASTPVLQEARVNLDRVVSDHTGNLKKSMGRKFKTYPQQERTIVVVGPRWPEGAHGHLVEFGTGPRFTKENAYRGEMPAAPFMRPAFDSTKERVKAMIATKLGDEIEKAAKSA